MSILTGTRIGRYEILELIGTGGMGEVYRARDFDLNRDVAIKFLPERFATSQERLARFAQEARTASSLNHPNIVTIHEIGSAPGVPPYIVMEFVRGRTIRTLLHEAPLARRLVLDVAAQLADGVAMAHAAGIVHRDLKPENVMVTPDGFVKILDFGLAKLRSAIPAGTAATVALGNEETVPSPDTAVGAVVGTAAYMSPEQARGDHADFHADQFAMAVVIYEMATGRPPFHGASFVQTLAAIIETEPPPIDGIRSDFPPAALQIVTRCLAKDPQDRYASTTDLARDLRAVRERLSDAGSQDEPVQVVREPGWARPRWRTWRVPALALAGLLVVLALVGVRGRLARWWSPLPSEMRLAVLPVTVDGRPADPPCCAGLQEYVTARLAELGRFRSRVAVVPAAEVLDSGARSPSAARRALGANLAFTISVHTVGTNRLVTVNLSDTGAVRQLHGASGTYAAASFSPEMVVRLATPLLDVELEPGEDRGWSSAASRVAEAGVLYAQGLGQTPYQQAQSLLEQVDYEASLERAIDLFNKAVDLDPRYAAAHAGLAEARLRLFALTKRADDLTLASQSVTRALAIDDTRPAAWTTLGMVRSAHGDIAGAEKAFNEAIKRNPAGADAYRELGTAYVRAGQYNRAEAAHRKAVSLNPKSWAVHNALGVFLAGQQRFAEAEPAFMRGLELAPANPRLLSNLGGVYLYLRRWSEAERALQQAVIDLPYGPALSNLGWLQFRIRRQYAEAARTFERASMASPRDYQVWKNLASAYRRSGQTNRATGALTTAVRLLEEERAIDPSNGKTLVELGDAQAMLGHAEQARPLLAEARRLAPGDGDVAYTAATGYEAIGEREAALDALAAAIEGGHDLGQVESDTGLAQLRADPRYGALLKSHGHRTGGPARQ